MTPTPVTIDEHAGFRAFARALLEAEGYDVVGEAADGSSGADLVCRLVPTWCSSTSCPTRRVRGVRAHRGQSAPLRGSADVHAQPQLVRRACRGQPLSLRRG